MMFMFDNNLSQSIAQGLKAFGENVFHIKEKFEEGVADEVWLPDAGREDWFVITRDDRIRINPIEKSLLIENRVGCFVLTGKNLKAWDIQIS